MTTTTMTTTQKMVWLARRPRHHPRQPETLTRGSMPPRPCQARCWASLRPRSRPLLTDGPSGLRRQPAPRRRRRPPSAARRRRRHCARSSAAHPPAAPPVVAPTATMLAIAALAAGRAWSSFAPRRRAGWGKSLPPLASTRGRNSWSRCAGGLLRPGRSVLQMLEARGGLTGVSRLFTPKACTPWILSPPRRRGAT